MNQAGRAGTVVMQPERYRAFHPAPLPPVPPVAISGELQRALSRADRALGRLDGSIATLPNPDLFVLMYVRKEAVLSSQIEGTQSSLNDLLAAEAQLTGADPFGDVDEVVNYVAAMNHGLRRLAELPVSVRLIRELHAQLLQGVRGENLEPGELRRSQNWIGPQGCGLSDAIFVPPPSHLVVEALGDLERFVHEDDDLPLLIKVGLAHAQFETIHPFLDGNGRVGRLLITFLLCEREVLVHPVLYLSHYLKAHRQTYYELLQKVRDDGDWEAWLTFFLTGVAEVSSEATETARRILRLREDHRLMIMRELDRSSGRGHQLLDHLYERPIISVNAVADLTGLSFGAANTLIERFERIGIVEEITGNARNRRYRYADYVALFA